jgi:S1-C subfamily serine protease
MEGRTDGNGAFQMAGMAPATRVRVWIGGKHDPFVAERIDVGIPGEGQVADAGVVRLLRGDELAGRLDGWVGLFVARRGSRVIVSAVSPWLPADLAGIIVGDVLVSIDGREVGGFGPRAVAFLMRGPPKTSAALVIEAHDGTRRKLILERVLR